MTAKCLDQLREDRQQQKVWPSLFQSFLVLFLQKNWEAERMLLCIKRTERCKCLHILMISSKWKYHHMIMTYHQIYSSAKTVTLIESNLVKYAKIFTSVIYISIIYANKMDLNFCIRYRFLKKLASNISLYLFCNIIRQFFKKNYAIGMMFIVYFIT